MLLTTVLLACAPEPGPSLPPDAVRGTTSEETTGVLAATACTVMPALTGDTVSLRVDPTGVVWNLSVDGLLTRYAAVDGDGCALEGSVVLGDGEFDAVGDLELDGEGRPYALVYFDTVARLDPDGAITLACPIASGHALAPTPAGDVVYGWPIGAESVSRVEMTDTCGEASTLPLAEAISVAGAIGPAGLAAASFDPAGDLPPGMVFDLDDGARISDLAPGGAVGSISDVVVAGDGWFVTDPVDRGLFQLGADGSMVVRYDPARLPGGEDQYLGFSSVAYQPGGTSYLAASDLDGAGIWRVEDL